ncbi:MAG: 50S ribosomal protein L18 [Planctomycetes bacterium]|nr:50S ribosomal protein L18 [Planctomycetota bacterium]
MSHIRSVELRKWERRERRAMHVRQSVYGTPERPRLSVYRSHRHFHAQLIDDTQGRTLAAASTLQKDLREQLKNGGDKKAAAAVGVKLAQAALAKGVKKVVFDRNFYRFHGRVRAFAEAAAKGGLDFLHNPRKKNKAPKVKKAEKPAEGKPPKAQKPAGQPQEKKEKKE